MAGYEMSVGSEWLPGLLNGQDGLEKRVERVVLCGMKPFAGSGDAVSTCRRG